MDCVGVLSSQSVLNFTNKYLPLSQIINIENNEKS